MIPVFKYVITERNSEIGYQFAAADLRESGKQSRYHAERYVNNSLGYACISFEEVHRLSYAKKIR